MTLWLILMLVACALCAFMLVMTLVNLGIYRRTPADAPHPSAAPATGVPLVSVCIPARNEESNLDAIVRDLLASDLLRDDLEVLVYDDHSTDRTPQILAALVAHDPRVRRVDTHPFPAGWVGKQHACDRLGRAARGQWLLFTDADVRFTPDCLRRTLDAADRLKADMISTFPRQLTGTLSEVLIVPMIHFILFSYLPMPRMRAGNDPSASAGCGQFLFIRRDTWEAVGGHAAWKDSMHDGIRMPRAVRRLGRHTDLFDGTDLAACRMYRGLSATWRGFTKNAYEGLGTPVLLVFLTVVHLLGHIMPWLYLAAAWLTDLLPRDATGPAVVAIALALVQRTILARRFMQSPVGVALHPLGVLLMTLIQWHSYLLHLTGQRAWRGRTLVAAPAVSE